MSENYTTLEGFSLFVTRLGSKYTMADELSKIGTMGLGLAGEAAEISAISLKYSGVHVSISEEDRLKIIDELGDICWYVAFAAANVVNVPFADLVVEVDKLSELCEAASLRYLSPQLSIRCGEVADIAKKLVYHGKPFDEATRAKLVEKLTDVMHNVIFIAKDVCGTELHDSINKNVEKLSERYKSLKFSTEEFMEKEQGKRIV